MKRVSQRIILPITIYLELLINKKLRRVNNNYKQVIINKLMSK